MNESLSPNLCDTLSLEPASWWHLLYHNWCSRGHGHRLGQGYESDMCAGQLIVNIGCETANTETYNFFSWRLSSAWNRLINTFLKNVPIYQLSIFSVRKLILVLSIYLTICLSGKYWQQKLISPMTGLMSESYLVVGLVQYLLAWLFLF